MKNCYLLLSFFMLTLCVSSSFAQAGKAKLTIEDRKNYILTIDKWQIKKPYDTTLIASKEKFSFTKIPVRLTNNSKDTLRYITMSCSWEDIYTSNTKRIIILSGPCDKNIPTIAILPPHQSKNVYLPVIFKKSDTSVKVFKIGINLQKQDKLGNYNSVDLDSNIKNLIWSNEVHIP